MIAASSGIAPEGFPIIAVAALAAILFALIKCPIIAIGLFIFCLFSVYFFRDPERVIPEEPDVAVSPADGRILHVTTREDPFTKEERCYISVFMNIFNVHVNRVPVDCTVEHIAYYPGKFFNASFDKASEFNERCAWQLQDADGAHWTMVQIAGLIARRIVCRALKGDALKRGERCGMIRFGSRVDLYLPASYHPVVRVGEHVFAGQTILARKQITE